MIGLEVRIAQNKTKHAQVLSLFVLTNGSNAVEVVA